MLDGATTSATDNLYYVTVVMYIFITLFVFVRTVVLITGQLSLSFLQELELM